MGQIIKLNTRGITRLVIELKNVVIKLPNFTYSWQHFLKGLLANIQESQTWKWHPRKDLLCPVLWCSWGGWLLVMRKADVSKHIKEVAVQEDIFQTKEYRETLYAEWIIEGLSGDDKEDNYGYINDRLVKIDYGN